MINITFSFEAKVAPKVNKKKVEYTNDCYVCSKNKALLLVFPESPELYLCEKHCNEFRQSVNKFLYHWIAKKSEF